MLSDTQQVRLYTETGQLDRVDGSGTYTNTFDDSGVLTQTDYPKATTRYATDDQGRRTDTWLQSTNTANTTWAGHEQTSYDTSSRVSELKAYTGTGDTSNTLVFDTVYCYNAASTTGCSTAKATDLAKLQWSRNVLTGQLTSYTYDTAGRVKTVAQSVDSNNGNTTRNYTYDARGNRLTAVATGTNASSQTLTYNAANQITTTGYTYDGAGNLTASPTATYTYNAAQQMTQVVKGGKTTTYTYAGAAQNQVLTENTAGGTSYALTYGKADQNGQPEITQYTAGSSTGYVYSDPITGQALMLTTSSGLAAAAVVRLAGLRGSRRYGLRGEITTTAGRNLEGVESRQRQIGVCEHIPPIRRVLKARRFCANSRTAGAL